MNKKHETNIRDDIGSFWKIHPKHVDWIFMVALYVVLSLFVFPHPGS